jgi:K+-transporting ATPase KdpF subunit
LFPFHESLRKNLNREDTGMLIYLTALVAVFLVAYLVTALVRPEWF